MYGEVASARLRIRKREQDGQNMVPSRRAVIWLAEAC